MERHPADDRSAIAMAWGWSSRILVIAVEMVAPGLLGYYFLDRWLGTKFLFLLIGLAIGMTGAILHLMQMTRSVSNVYKSQPRKPQ
jgi:F0F1-type ATP synthase assembly protein I